MSLVLSDFLSKEAPHTTPGKENASALVGYEMIITISLFEMIV